jgi:hypothetical protein
MKFLWAEPPWVTRHLAHERFTVLEKVDYWFLHG